MASSRKKFGKPEPTTRIKILPVEEPGPEAPEPEGGGKGQASAEAPLTGAEMEALTPTHSNEPLGRRLARQLQEHPEQVKRLFASWVEEEEN